MALPPRRLHVDQAESRPVDEQTVRTTYPYKREPPPAQEQALALVVRRCRQLYNAGLHERGAAWHRCGVDSTAARQRAQLPEGKVVRLEDRDVHSHVRHDVLPRLDRAVQAFFRRVKAGETPGDPRVHGANRDHSCTYQQFGNGATIDNSFLVRSKIGRVALRWSRPLAGIPQTLTLSRDADGS